MITWLRSLIKYVNSNKSDIGEERADLLLTRIERILTLYYASLDEGYKCELPQPPSFMENPLYDIANVIDTLDRVQGIVQKCYKKAIVSSHEVRTIVYLGASIQLAIAAYITLILQPPFWCILLALVGLAPSLAAFTLPLYRITSSLLLLTGSAYLLALSYYTSPAPRSFLVTSTLLAASLLLGLYRLTMRTSPG